MCRGSGQGILTHCGKGRCGVSGLLLGIETVFYVLGYCLLGLFTFWRCTRYLCVRELEKVFQSSGSKVHFLF